jgi:hypothetical protein
VPRVAFSIHAAYGLLNGGVATQTGSSTGDPASIALLPPAGGVAVAFGYLGQNGDCSWTGLTMRADNLVDSQLYSVADGLAGVATSPITCSHVGTAFSDPIVVAGTFR